MMPRRRRIQTALIRMRRKGRRKGRKGRRRRRSERRERTRTPMVKSSRRTTRSPLPSLFLPSLSMGSRGSAVAAPGA